MTQGPSLFRCLADLVGCYVVVIFIFNFVVLSLVKLASLDRLLCVWNPLLVFLAPMGIAVWFTRSPDHPNGANVRCAKTAPSVMHPNSALVLAIFREFEFSLVLG